MAPVIITNYRLGLDGGFSLSGTGALGPGYVLLAASDLASPGAWTAVLTNPADTNGVFAFQVSAVHESAATVLLGRRSLTAIAPMRRSTRNARHQVA